MAVLPEDLLCEIFLLLIQPPPPLNPWYESKYGATPLDILSTLTMVSKDWRLLIEQTPSLWTYLSSDDPTSVTTKALSLSKAAPLRITCIGMTSEGRRSDTSIRLFIELVKPHVERWRTAVFREVPVDSLPYDCLEMGAPVLESLVLNMGYSSSAQNPFAGGPLPRLGYLYCIGDVLQLSGGLLSGLSSLTIEHSIEQSIKVLDLAQILTNNPRLTMLRIKLRLSRLTAGDTYHGQLPIVDLPCLKTLDLALPGSLGDFLVRHIHAPACSKFRYDICDDPWEGSLGLIIPFFRSTLSSANTHTDSRRRIWITPNSEYLNLKVTYEGLAPRNYAFSFFSWRLDGAEDLTWFVDQILPTLNVEAAVTLWLAEGFPFQEKAQLQGFLRKLPRATDLRISGEYQPEVLFDILSTALEGESVNGDMLLLPGMKEISIVALDCDWTCLLRMLEARARIVGGMSSPAPLKLRLMDLDMDEDVMQRIVELLGQENVMA